MDGSKRNNSKYFKKNFVSSQGSYKMLCPVCLYRDGEFEMVKDEKSKMYVCKNCGYDIPPHMDPVADSKLEAGNEADVSKPYLKTVSFPAKKTINDVRDTYDNPMDAWTSGP